jgi:lipoate-protein ligase B
VIRDAVAPLIRVDAGLVPYATAYGWQQSLHARRVGGEIDDVLLLLEHPHVYTLGRRFRRSHLLADPGELSRLGVEVHEADRGGSVTYHGPGQLIAYPVVDLRPPGGGLPDMIGYLRLLEAALIEVAARFRVDASARPALTGVWVGGEKLASIGINVSRGVAKHGLALNVSTDLSYFAKIVPCGIEGCRLTSLERLLGASVALDEVAGLLAGTLARRLGRRLESAGIEQYELVPPLQRADAVGF